MRRFDRRTDWVAFDGTNIWVTNSVPDNVSKIIGFCRQAAKAADS